MIWGILLRKRILFYLSDLEKGGAQRVICNLANYLVNSYEVSIITTKESQAKYLLNNNIKVYNLKIKESKYRFANIFRRLYKLISLIRTINPDITITFLTSEIYRILIVKPFINSKVIISVRNDPNGIYNTKMKRRVINLLLRLTDGAVFQTHEAKSFFTKKVYKKSTIIMNPINENFIKPLYKGKRKKEIVAVGKLFEQKNHKLLINSFSKIVDKFPDYKLVIYGEGILRANLEEQVKNLCLEDKVLLPGISNNIVDSIYDSSLFVLSSDFEGVSNALLEALSLGLPVISTDCSGGGAREIINHGINGLLVPVNDVNELAESIERVLSDEKLSRSLSENAALMQEKLNPQKINKQWESYILDVIGG